MHKEHLNAATGTWEEEQGSQDMALLPSATRTTSAQGTTADQSNPSCKGVVVYINITAASGTGGLTVVLQTKDPVSGNYVTFATLTSGALTATGQKAYACYPGISNGYTSNTNSVVPRTWRVQVQHGDSSNYTYSVGACLLR